MNQGKKLYRHMGEEKIRMGNNHKKKNKNIINRNGGGNGGGGNDIAGLVFAAVGFIAVVTFSIIKHRTKPKPKPQNPLDEKCNKSIEDHEIETNQGLHALVQPSNSTSTTTTKDEDVVALAPCKAITDAKSINHTFIEEEKIECVSEVVSETSIHHDEIVLSDDFNSESAVSEAEKMDDDDEAAISEIVEEKNCSLNATLNTDEKEEFNSKDERGKIDVQNEEHLEEKTDTEEGWKNDMQNEEHVAEKADTEEGRKNDMQNEEHVAEKTNTEVGDDNDDVNVESEIAYEEKGNLSMEVNDEDQPISVSNSNQFSTLLMLLPGLILLLVLLLLMNLTKNIFSALVL